MGAKTTMTAVVGAATMLLGLAGPSAHADGPADEQQFVQFVWTLPMYALPMGGASTTADILNGGYRACAAMDQYPNNPMQAATAYYSTYGVKPNFERMWFMRYASSLLCNRHDSMYANL